jgi:outer membrane protein OmpA-like peptidoglycan-associated protein
MKSNRYTVPLLALSLSLALAAPAFTQEMEKDTPGTLSVSSGEKRKLEGKVAERDADSFLLATLNGSLVRVKLAGDTEIREKKTNPFRDAKKYTIADVVRGLDVEVEGRGDSSGVLVAKKIKFTEDDMKVAHTVETRVTPVEGRLGTAETRLTADEQNAKRMSGQIQELDAIANAAKGGAKAAQETADQAMHGVSAANGRIDAANDRITSLDDYQPIQNTTVYFKVNSVVLSAEAKESLDQLAEQAKNQKGYVVEIAGFASKDGNESYNQQLSERRAEAVRQYLAMQHEIPLRRIITPMGYGISHPVAENTNRKGREENRRTEVRILVSKGLSASSTKATPSDNSSTSLRNNQ